MLIDAVKTRLEARIPELAGEVGTAVDFTSLSRSGQALRGGVNVFVLPAGSKGLQATAGTGYFVQGVRRAVSIVSMLQSTDPKGRRALERLDGWLDDITQAVCGWAPDEVPGVFELLSERPVQAPAGVMAFMTDLQITDRLRTTP
ncbi:hypothetical protein J4E08_10075 [Sagittula sp. NFXS13]|uniref:phage tail terminator protein n=1 Tax=Sagittula sp. NFXS13 TaxID=2819095 RepID=UPI0032E04F62